MMIPSTSFAHIFLPETKVETIGDCYVAVTGLPEPQEDHALRMVKFANECRTKFIDTIVPLNDFECRLAKIRQAWRCDLDCTRDLSQRVCCEATSPVSSYLEPLSILLPKWRILDNRAKSK
mmetsp:Transcript_13610/g.39216  ORF Transcript_13610/g.39216 Transcript_13610/m.39216 type:complete len:121 (+) Transcript_13610:186-548(+)